MRLLQAYSRGRADVNAIIDGDIETLELLDNEDDIRAEIEKTAEFMAVCGANTEFENELDRIVGENFRYYEELQEAYAIGAQSAIRNYLKTRKMEEISCK